MKPLGGEGFAYMQGPDDALIEYQGNLPRERFNHVHMYQEEPSCAQAWYVKHLNATAREGTVTRTESDCKASTAGEVSWPALDKGGMIRNPTGGVTFDDVALNWYPNPSYAPWARAAACADPRPTLRSLRAERHRSGCVDREAAKENVRFYSASRTSWAISAR